RYAENAMIDPNTAKYAIARIDAAGGCAGSRSPVSHAVSASAGAAHSIWVATFIGPSGMSWWRLQIEPNAHASVATSSAAAAQGAARIAPPLFKTITPKKPTTSP